MDKIRILIADDINEQANYLKSIIEKHNNVEIIGIANDGQEEYNKIIDDKKMIDIYNSCNNNYEKLQIYRIINDGKDINDDIIKKFISRT